MLDGQHDVLFQRSKGCAKVVLRNRSGKAAIAELHQSGAAKAFLPRGGVAAEDVVFLNTSGGLTSGDHLHFDLTVPAGLRMTATTQTAERAYAAPGGSARMQVDLRVGADARLDWLPQETILFESAHLHRQTCLQLEAGASCLFAETIILGRLARGEAPQQARLTDRRMILRQGRPVWADALQFGADALAIRDQPASLGMARCFAVIVLIAQGAEDAASALRPLLGAAACETALSAWNGRLVVRLKARDSWPLKCQMARCLTQLRGTPLPRVWQMNGDIA